ncbi:hypothetical protein SYNPS1DRAFT_27554 [Syncephalis pseudoplumigaleata]|uniref:Uncharacterized protein n=1 Tax=Syncephalis pseudoplumigaleata TaxID=1712513 RepID=A0A4P9Z587_9FUNG|nr:hypothetical protein SYNPS1DRAFT_27554 [Syncephalis pseudoplumigaleata]|eukprot:RKP26770.1 hypothetical protein SYNPS1DRAFT_27554 [Syncephalis pseudoplumigaleata]
MAHRVVSTQLPSTQLLVRRLTAAEILQLLKAWSTTDDCLPLSYKPTRHRSGRRAGATKQPIQYDALADQSDLECAELLREEYPDGLTAAQVAQLDFQCKHRKTRYPSTIYSLPTTAALAKYNAAWDELVVWQKEAIQRNITARLSTSFEHVDRLSALLGDAGRARGDTARDTGKLLPMEDAPMEDDPLQLRHDVAHMQLGSDPLPVLTRVHYNITYDLCEASSLGPANMRATFEGPHVLEGFRQLLHSPVGNPPLPKHMARLPSLAVNTVHMDFTEAGASADPLQTIVNE